MRMRMGICDDEFFEGVNHSLLGIQGIGRETVATCCQV